MCSNIFNLEHKPKKIAKSNVSECVDLEYLQRWLPEFPWFPGIMLCSSCRNKATRQARDAEKLDEARKVTNDVIEAVVRYVNGDLVERPTELDIYKGICNPGNLRKISDILLCMLEASMLLNNPN